MPHGRLGEAGSLWALDRRRSTHTGALKQMKPSRIPAKLRIIYWSAKTSQALASTLLRRRRDAASDALEALQRPEGTAHLSP